MALVERLCQVDEHEPGGEPQTRHMAYALFVSGLFAVLHGRWTPANIKSFYQMTSEDISEFDTLVGRIQAYPTDAERVIAVQQVTRIMSAWEAKDDYPVPGHLTVANIRTELSNI